MVYRLLQAETNKGYTALHLAAMQRDKSTAQTLLDWGTNPTVKCKAGKTALEVSPDDGEEASGLRSLLQNSQGRYVSS